MGSPIRIYASKKFLMNFDLVVAKADYQTAKFNALPNFLAIW